MAKTKSPNHYVDNKRLLDEMVQYREKVKVWKEKKAECEESGAKVPIKPAVPRYVAESLLKIAERLSTMPSFVGYPYREEMVGDGVVNCIEYIDNFNPEKSKNPFSYFTQIIYFAFLRRIKKEQKITSIKVKAFDQVMLEMDLAGMSAELQNVKPTLAMKKDKMDISS